MNSDGHRESPETAAESGWSVVAKWLLGLALVILVLVILVGGAVFLASGASLVLHKGPDHSVTGIRLRKV